MFSPDKEQKDFKSHFFIQNQPLAFLLSSVKIMEKYKCVICGYIYDAAEGDPSGGIEPGMDFNDLPSDYICPVCGAGKDEFLILD